MNRREELNHKGHKGTKNTKKIMDEWRDWVP